MTPGAWSDPAGQDSWEDLSKWGEFEGEPWDDEQGENGEQVPDWQKEWERQDIETGVTRVLPIDFALACDVFSPMAQMLLAQGGYTPFVGYHDQLFALEQAGIQCLFAFEVAFNGAVCWVTPDYQAARARRLLGLAEGEEQAA